jgi:hypothetical protein
VHRPATDFPAFDTDWLDGLAEGCRGLRGSHPRFEDLYLERRLEIRVAPDASIDTVRLEGGAARWRFPSRWAMHAGSGISSAAVAELVSHYADRLKAPPRRRTRDGELNPPPGWIESAISLAGRGVDVRFFKRWAVVIRRDGWREVSTPALIRVEQAAPASGALLAVSGHPSLAEWVRSLLDPPPAKTWNPPSGTACPVIFTDGSSGVLLHELVGHMVEGDLVASGRSPLAGLGGANLSEAEIDLVDDPRRADLPGAFDTDDEGVRSGPITLLRSGRLCGVLCDRETAETCGVPAGRGRRTDWRLPPIPRLSNLVVPPGTGSPQDLEADLKRGLVVTRLAGATVDPVSSRAVLRVERGHEIRNGRRRRPLGPFELTGGVIEILAGIDPTVGDDPTPDWRLGWCLKDGLPLPTGSEAPTMLVHRLEVL